MYSSYYNQVPFPAFISAALFNDRFSFEDSVLDGNSFMLKWLKEFGKHKWIYISISCNTYRTVGFICKCMQPYFVVPFLDIILGTSTIVATRIIFKNN